MKPSLVWTVGLVAWLAGCAAAGGDRQPADAAAMDDGAPGGAIDAAPDAAGEIPPAGTRLRLVTGNLTTGNFQSYEAPGIRIFRGLAADVAMVQELNVADNSPAELRAFVDQAFGTEYALVRGAPAQIPNGIVSRYPIIASGEWLDAEVGDRDFVWAQIDIPGPIDLYAISVHLLSSSATRRDSEAGALVANIRGLPAGAYVALGGDFNTQVRGEPCIQTLSAVVATAGPYPVDQADLDNTNANRNRPYDWVVVNGALDALETGVAIGGNRFANGLVVDTRVYAPIGDLAPALAGDSGAPSMQHMAVVRDFALPVASSP